MRTLILILTCLFLAIPCEAEIFIVDDDGLADFNNIQAAINDSNDGDVIVVFPGTYTGGGNRDIDFGGRAVTVTSVAPEDPYIVAATVIDCQDSGRGFYFHSGEDANSVLDGLTVTNGSASYGGGIYCSDAGPVITNCTITGNAAVWEGGGLYGCAGPVTNCTFTGNYVVDRGGALAFCTGPITNCLISNNTANRDAGGLAFCDGPIIGCTVSGNQANQEDTGGLGACGDIINCIITGNSAPRDAGAMGMCYGIIANCIISGNSAGADGGAMRHCDGLITNCTITGNFAAGRGGAMYACDGIVSNCIISDNRSVDSSALSASPVPIYSCVPAGTYGIECISSDPCFVVPGYWDDNGTPNSLSDDFWVDGDYHLHPDSPCIDAGSYYYFMPLPSSDYGGGTRLAGAQIDMGCYEFGNSPDADGDWLADACEPAYADDPDRDDDGVLDGLELLRGMDPNVFDPLGQWNVPADANTIQQALFFGRSGETVALSEGAYYENIHIGGRNIILTGTDPNDRSVVAATVINGDADANSQTANGRVITFAGSEDANCHIRGLTITGGCANRSGGGISGCRLFTDQPGALAAIVNCTVVANSGGHRGGGLYRCDGRITRSTISGNSARYGGGLQGCGGPITECTISGNSGHYGGALHVCDGSITSCVITGNTTDGQAAAICYCDGPITNCTIVGNLATLEGAGLCHCEGPIRNCIIWDNQPADTVIYNSSTPLYSCVQGGSTGLGCINSDPCFVAPGYWDSNGTPDDANDDFWVNGDYHLKSEGWRWHEEREVWTWDDMTSRCIDAGNPGSAPGEELLSVPDDPNNLWGENLRINMGAYGGTAEASMPPYDWALLADLTNDGIVDGEDFAHQAEDWQKSDDEQPGDLNRDGIVYMYDVGLLADDWLKTTSWY